jgi:3-hydroxy-9,10-secoandrosta-1,3,5(10)-triene-9,17-dione monooxygenase reductase component
MATDRPAQDQTPSALPSSASPDAAQPINPTTFRQALGQFPTGVTVVTAEAGDHPVGMTANSFSSVSLDPPLVLWSVAQSSPSHDSFVAADAFAIHFLGADHGELAMRFGRRGSDKFADIDHRPGITGAPLIDGLAPIFECKTWARYAGGDHTILVGEVVRFVEHNHDPLVFHSGQMRRIDKGQRQPPPLASDSFARNYLPYLLARASFNVSSEFHARLKDWDLTVPEWRVLACLTDVEGLSVGELAAMALMKQPGLTKTLDRMEADALLKRKSISHDRRRVTLHLTAKGRARVKPALKAALAHEASVLDRFNDDERATIKYALDLLIDSDQGDEATD